ncbi:MAG TPA: Clp protease N-terminal domain-containing protein [Acidimicrobiales bacterium]|nr:Clp protease N-terminal domain-containing protein [Acidimicrobiales bacterium]
MNSIPAVDELVRTIEATSETDLDRVRAAVELADELGTLGDEVVTHFVGAARAAGCSWSQIGSQLGVSKQAAQQAFVAPVPGAGRGRGRRFGGRGRGGGGDGSGRPFERFATVARTVVMLARQEAVAMGATHVGTEHLLLGLLDHGEGVAAEALSSVGVGAEAVRQRVGALVERKPGPPSLRVPLAPRAKEVFALAVREGVALGQHRVGPGHLLLGIIDEGEGLGAKVLVELGVDLPGLRSTVLEMLRTADGPRTPGGPRSG